VRAFSLLLLAGCIASGPKTNEAVFKNGRAMAWRGPITRAEFRASVEGKPTVITMNDAVELTINSCYAHAHSAINGRDKVTVERLDDKTMATDGTLDIDDCTTTHVKGHLLAGWADGKVVEAVIDTELVLK